MSIRSDFEVAARLGRLKCPVDYPVINRKPFYYIGDTVSINMRQKVVVGSHVTGKLEKTAKHWTQDSSTSLSVLVGTLLPRCRRLLLYLIAFNNTHTHSVELLWTVDRIGPSQRPLPDNAQHSQETNIHAPAGFEPTISASERQQTCALVRAATEIG